MNTWELAFTARVKGSLVNLMKTRDTLISMTEFPLDREVEYAIDQALWHVGDAIMNLNKVEEIGLRSWVSSGMVNANDKTGDEGK